MSTPLLVITIVVALGLGCGAAVLFLRGRPQAKPSQPVEQAATTATPAFRWWYVALPLAVLVLSVALVAYFYRLLPAEVAYHFTSDGTPDGWLSRSAAVLWTLLPQFLLTLLAGATTWGIAQLDSLFKSTQSTGLRLGQLLAVMGNMVALPQVILFFAMLDIFSYNSYEVRILPVWAFALIVMVLGAIILGVFFLRTFRQVKGTPR